MKYHVTRAAELNFADGSKVTLVPGIHEFADDVATHWAFSEYATPIDAPVKQPVREISHGKKQQTANS